MNPLKKLIEQVGRPQSVVGSIVSATEKSLSVMTPNGLVQVERSFPDAFSAGDDVQIVNGQIVGRLRSQSSLPVYYV